MCVIFCFAHVTLIHLFALIPGYTQLNEAKKALTPSESADVCDNDKSSKGVDHQSTQPHVVAQSDAVRYFLYQILHCR